MTFSAFDQIFEIKISVFGFRTAKNLVLMSKRENLVIHATKIMRVNYFHLLLQKKKLKTWGPAFEVSLMVQKRSIIVEKVVDTANK